MATHSKTTTSRCTTEEEMGTHKFEIIGYNVKKGMGIGNFVQSATFTIDDHS
jgi:speckle-type POZ protein